MGDDLELFLLKNSLEESLIPQLSFYQSKPCILQGLGEVAALDRRFVKIVEIIEADNAVSFGEQPVNQMGPDKSRAARY
jgi:hypothetical protein